MKWLRCCAAAWGHILSIAAFQSFTFPFSSPHAHLQFCREMSGITTRWRRDLGKTKLWPVIDRQGYLWVRHRWGLKLTTHVIAQPPGGQVIGPPPTRVPKRLKRDRAAFRQAAGLRGPPPRGSVDHSRYAASLESSPCWSCRCCSPTCSSGASGRTSEDEKSRDHQRRADAALLQQRRETGQKSRVCPRA